MYSGPSTTTPLEPAGRALDQAGEHAVAAAPPARGRSISSDAPFLQPVLHRARGRLASRGRLPARATSGGVSHTMSSGSARMAASSPPAVPRVVDGLNRLDGRAHSAAISHQ